MRLTDILFITKQFFWVGKRRYDIIRDNCETLKERHGECYAYHYTMFLVEYYKKIMKRHIILFIGW